MNDNKILKILKNKAVSNAGWMIAGKIVQMVISLFVGIFTARFLGPGNYGLINYGSAYITFFSSLCTLGINSVIVKEIIDHKEQEGMVLGTAMGMRLVSSIFSVFMIWGISMFLDAGEPETQLVVFLCSLSLVFHVFDMFTYWFQAKLQAKKNAIATLIAYMIMAAYKIFLLWQGKSVYYFAVATSIDYIFMAIILYWFYKKDNGGKLQFSWKYGKGVLAKSCHFILPGLMVAIYGQTDKIMLKQLYGAEEIGYYSTATALCSMWCFVLSAVIDSINPLIMESHNDDKAKYRKLNVMLYAIIFYVCMAVSVLFTLFGGFAVELLYGKEFLPAVAPLKIVTWYTAFSYLGVAKNSWIVCENKQKYLIYIYFGAAITNVLLNAVLIPGFGASGAAVASLIAQMTTVIILPFFIKGLRPNAVLMMEGIFLKGILKRGKKCE